MISSEQSEDFIVATPRFHLLFLVFTGFYHTAIVSSSKNLSSDTSAVPRDSKPVETTCIKLQEHSAGLSRKTVREEPKEPHEKPHAFLHAVLLINVRFYPSVLSAVALSAAAVVGTLVTVSAVTGMTFVAALPLVMIAFRIGIVI